MPVWNAELYVRDAIESILNQTFCDFELLIINDGSSDHSQEIITSLAARDDRIRYINREHRGLVKTRNEGLDRSRGEYLALMDADDISIPTRLDRQLLFLRKHPDIAGCGSAFQMFGGSHAKVFHPNHPDDIKIALLFDSAVGNPTAIVRKDAINKSRIRFQDDGNAYAEDYRFWVNLSHHFKIANIPEVLLQYRVYAQQGSSIQRQAQIRAATEICREQLEELGLELDFFTAYLMRWENHKDQSVFDEGFTPSDLLILLDEKFREILDRNRCQELYHQKILLTFLRRKLLRTALAIGTKGLTSYLYSELQLKKLYEHYLVSLILLKRRFVQPRL